MGDVRVDALRGVMLRPGAGELLVRLGPSGSGTSTLLNILGGLDVPTSGHLAYRGDVLASAGDAALTRYRRGHVGVVFEFYNLVPTRTGCEHVALVTDLADDAFVPAQALEVVGMSHRADHFPAQLSGGQQQRVAAARAIAKRPDVHLADGKIVADRRQRTRHEPETLQW
jgi:putative ABC transport system ATP-binding protein